MANRVAHLNRDQIVLVALHETASNDNADGANIFVSGSSDTLNEFIDQLVNLVGSNCCNPRISEPKLAKCGGPEGGKNMASNL